MASNDFLARPAQAARDARGTPAGEATIPLGMLFDDRAPGTGEPGSGTWNQKIFQRAYLEADGPFRRVLTRLDLGFSILVYLPGNCISVAAAEAGTLWGQRATMLGQPSQDGQMLSNLWEESAGVFTRLARWISGADRDGPRLIFQNLDFLTDGRGGVDQSDAAKTAIFYLASSARTGVVLGLSDCEAGPLPEPIRRPFAEEIWLDRIDAQRFRRLIPRSLGEKLAGGGALPVAVEDVLASRLRWSDPMRAVAILSEAANEVGERPASGVPGKTNSLTAVLHSVREATRTVEFLRQEELGAVAEDQDENPTGFEKETVEFLSRAVVKPFQRWAEYAIDEEERRRRFSLLPPGLILYGPPGTGKTRLARWIARTVDLPVRQVTAADLKEADYGAVERNVRGLFASARRAAPCVIVLDDADDLLPDRNAVQGSVAAAERGAVNAFLQEVEGVRGRLEGVLLILTTNRFDDIDRAARERLRLHRHVPYPLTREQVETVVESVASSYGISLDAYGVLEKLTERFFRPVRRDGAVADYEDEDVRRSLDHSLFSPRQIDAAMAMLATISREPTKDHVDQMEQDIERSMRAAVRGAP